VIWQLDKGKKKRIWKTLSISVIAILEQAYQEKKTDVKVKDLAVSIKKCRWGVSDERKLKESALLFQQ
jgi:hypothetical protein